MTSWLSMQAEGLVYDFAVERLPGMVWAKQWDRMEERLMTVRLWNADLNQAAFACGVSAMELSR